jgi:predicted NUDIX family NTP pyrophosphohydrolase
VKGPFELLGNAPKQSGDRFDVAFSIRGTWELNAHRKLLFSGGRNSRRSRMR